MPVVVTALLVAESANEAHLTAASKESTALDSAVETGASGIMPSAAAHVKAMLGRLARFTIQDWNSDGGDLVTAALDGAVGADFSVKAFDAYEGAAAAS